MKIYVNVKQIGSRKNYITKEEIKLNKKPSTLRELIELIVIQNVKEFNEGIKNKSMINYLTEEEIENKIESGKISFGEKYNQNRQNVKKAIETAYLAYKDGIFTVFIGETEAGTLDEVIELKEDDILTFIKFTMLAGRMW